MKEKLTKKEVKRFKKYRKAQESLIDEMKESETPLGKIMIFHAMEENKSAFWDWLMDRHPDMGEGAFTLKKKKGSWFVKAA